MIPLILLALGLGVALSAYELSPRAHSRIDDYARVIREAHDAHLAADAHLNHANMAAGAAGQHAQAADGAQHPAHEDAHMNAGQAAADAGIEHAVASTDANQEAAKKTVELAQKAKTEAERAFAAQSAAKVIAREQEIANALVKLGVGECGVRSYAGVTPQVKDALIAKLRAAGMSVTGDNPWNIDPHEADVKLRAVWDPKAQVLKLIVTSSAIWAPCSEIWKRIEPKLRELGVQAGR